MSTPASTVSIAIMGAGAIGSATGGMLARAGHRVTLIGSAPHPRDIKQRASHHRHPGHANGNGLACHDLAA